MGQILIDKGLTITDQTAPTTISVDPAHPSRIFAIGTRVPSAVTISNIVLTGGNATNTPESGGGALFILNTGGSVSLTDVMVSGNTAVATAAGGGSAFGGGILSLGSLTLLRVTVSGNTVQSQAANTQAFGGGIASSGTLTATNSTITNNTATASGAGGAGAGGGIFQSMGTATLTNVTLASNAVTGAVAFGGNIISSGSVINLKLTIIAGGVATTGANCVSVLGTFVTQGYNLESTTPSQCGLVPAPAGTDLVGVDPKLGPLADNGGLGLTRALLPGSPAIGVAPPVQCTGPPQNGTDQRGPGFQRPVGLCDVGAFEVQAPYGFAPRVGGLRVSARQVSFSLVAPAAVTITVHGVGRFTVQGHHGLNRLRLPAIVAGQHLHHGRYRVSAVASVQGHVGRPTQATLTI